MIQRKPAQILTPGKSCASNEKMTQNTDSVCIDIPMSCSLFLEPALLRYQEYLPPVTEDTLKYVHEWNLAMLATIRQNPQYAARLGQMGRKLLTRQNKTMKYIPRCVSSAEDARQNSLHYAIRFAESNKFLGDAIAKKQNLKFVDLGCGLSPMAASIQTYNTKTRAYCIDFPYIADIYTDVANAVGTGTPTFLSWEAACTMAADKKLDAVVAMGVLPYMSQQEQESRLKFINEKFPKFLAEIKYRVRGDRTAGAPNSFTLPQLQKLQMDIPHVNTIETTLLQNCMRYLHTFRTALPQSRDFVSNTRSLFLSR